MALQRFLSRNLRSPNEGMETGSVIRVLVRFVVDRDGSITGIEFEKSGGRDYDNEVLRVMKKMPAWKPGMQNGRTVAVYFKIPVVFQSAPDN
jgi:protein TonB